MSVLDEILNVAITIIQQYGWYAVGLLLLWSMLPNIYNYLPQSIQQYLSQPSASEIKRTKQLDKHMWMVRKKQIQAFEMGVNVAEVPEQNVEEIVDVEDAIQISGSRVKTD
jgi:predicted Co/Zn/Cd cation transporter (cation efflux family)